jgi:hypothetical protein
MLKWSRPLYCSLNMFPCSILNYLTLLHFLICGDNAFHSLDEVAKNVLPPVFLLYLGQWRVMSPKREVREDTLLTLTILLLI